MPGFDPAAQPPREPGREGEPQTGAHLPDPLVLAVQRAPLERDGEILGSVFLMPEDEDTARLRVLYVEPKARGLGLGRQLVELCISFARSAGY